MTTTQATYFMRYKYLNNLCAPIAYQSQCYITFLPNYKEPILSVFCHPDTKVCYMFYSFYLVTNLREFFVLFCATQLLIEQGKTEKTTGIRRTAV